MKTLLVGINAKYIHSNPAIYSLQKSARAYAGCFGASVGEIAVREFTINQNPQTIYYEILQERPDLVGFSTYIWNVTLVAQLCRDLKKVRPEIEIFMGGPEVSFGLEHTEITDYDYVIEGEGERPFYGLLAGGENVPAEWHYHHEGKRIWADPPECLDEIPFLYEDTMPMFQNRILYYEASRGCPFHCGYCLSAAEKGVRERSLPLVLRELQFLVDAGVPLIKFVDRTFNCHPERAAAVLDFVRKLPETVQTCFHFEVEADRLTEDLIERMCVLPPNRIQVEIGIQSTCKKTLQACHRTPTVERCFTNIRRLVAAGNMKVHVDLIAGLPYEGYERFGQSLAETCALGAHQLQLGFLKRLQGTPLAAEEKRYGYVFSAHPPYEILRNDFLGEQELWRLKQIEDVLERLGNSGRFVHFLGCLKKQYDNTFAMWEALTDYWVQAGQIFATIGAVETFRVVARFAQGQKGSEELLAALLLDFYSFTSSDQIPVELQPMVGRPADHKAVAVAALKSMGVRDRKLMVRFCQGQPVVFDYTEKDPVRERYERV